MAIPRESIQVALLNRLKAIPGFKTSTRKLKHYDDVPAENQPALIVTASGGMADRASDYPMLTHEIAALVYIYVREPDDDATLAETTIHGFLDKIEDALEPQNGETGSNRGQGTNLGGLVQSCFLKGYSIDVFGGGQTVTAVRIEMVAAE
jgi:hypothetical protein